MTAGPASTPTALPTAWATLTTALQDRRPVTVCYHGLCRIVCPHALGWKNARPMVITYQTGGQTSTGHLDPDPRKRWRLMYIDEIDQVLPADPGSIWDTADNYNYARPFPTIDELAIAISLPTIS
ncbi:MAG TPA: hypothetical protein VMM13_13125 [Euzebya sp.]|nr:hypothetical protein [Euzebya sp.]